MTNPRAVPDLTLEDHTGAARSLASVVAERGLTVHPPFRGFW